MSNGEKVAREIETGEVGMIGHALLGDGPGHGTKHQPEHGPKPDTEHSVNDNRGLAAQWTRVKARMAVELGEATYSSWLKPVDLIGIGDGCVVLAAPTKFIRSWVVAHQAERLLLLWQEEDPALKRLEIHVSADARASAQRSGCEPVRDPGQPLPPASENKPDATVVSPAIARARDEVLPEEVGAPLDERFTFDNFVVGKSNELAHAAARRVAEATDVTFNPLFLYGGVGLGKTHLMHAIAWDIRRRHPERKVLYLSAEKFMYQFVRALRFKDTMAFKQRFRTVDVLMIDDVQFISGKESTQEEFFHTFNAFAL